MTLYKQLSLAVFFIFTLVLCLAFYYAFSAIKGEYLANESRQFVQLSDQISNDLQPVLFEPQLKGAKYILTEQLLQQGIARAALINSQGQVVLSIDNTNIVDSAPAWFKALFRVPVLSQSLPISDSAIGELELSLESSTAPLYGLLWQQAKQLVTWLLLIYIFAVLLACTLIKRLLKPLEDLSHGAEDLQHHHLVEPISVPHAQELEGVAKALNEMSSTINLQFQQQAEVAESIRDKIYRDEVSGLGNRAYFMGQAKAWIDESGSGGLALLSLDVLDDVYLEQGEEGRNQLVSLCAAALIEALSTDDSFVVARLSVNEFACLLPGQEKDQLLAIAQRMQWAVSELVVSPMDAAPSISYIGLVQRTQNESVTELLSRADNALQIARSQRDTPIHLIECSEQYNLGRVGWKHLVQEAIHQDLFYFKAQPVLSKVDQHVLHAELFTYIVKEEHTYFAGQFMPAIEHFKLGCLFDQYVLKKLPLQLNFSAYQSIAVNLTLTSCVDSDFHEWLGRFLAQNQDLKHKVFLELPETVFVAHTEEVAPLIQTIKEAGFCFGIDQYGRHFQSLNYLEQLRPSYVKVDHSYTNQVNEIKGDSEFLEAVCQAATKLNILTIATRVENQIKLDLLSGLHIDAYQGFISPPMKLEKIDIES
ncbi:EAL domain-containing protein [Motilimonas cestriensis]|uniref:EAL domain-containing protein n=1 Tax=Motilimonas cestriensis TaxID=2742685 RepID=A0ABS8WDZ7_9GAMM|nr:EAL domain-containing protein [Motilimonas cestriensis]MCE2596537.1 EAL domain-containing protein [Motilimonas cestriensis]